MSANKKKLPEGFSDVPTGRKPAISFDVDHNRFYLSQSLRDEFNITEGSRVGLAYNAFERQLCVDLNGRAFLVNRQGYIVSKHFKERSYAGNTDNVRSPIKYVRNSDYKEFEASGLIFFDER